MTDDARLRSAYEQLLAARTPADRAGCPAPEALLALAERTGDEDARLATLDHVLGCTWCRSELDLLRASADAASTVVRESARVSRGVRRIPVRTLAMAAGIVVVIGVGVIAREREGGGNERGVLRGTAPSVVLAIPERRADGAVLLRWSSLNDAARYRIELFTATGATVGDAVVRDTTYVVSAAVMNGATGPLSWMVTAIRSDGAERSSPMGQIAP